MSETGTVEKIARLVRMQRSREVWWKMRGKRPEALFPEISDAFSAGWKAGSADSMTLLREIRQGLWAEKLTGLPIRDVYTDDFIRRIDEVLGKDCRETRVENNGIGGPVAAVPDARDTNSP
jgi:hypothetical protein